MVGGWGGGVLGTVVVGVGARVGLGVAEGISVGVVVISGVGVGVTEEAAVVASGGEVRVTADS